MLKCANQDSIGSIFHNYNEMNISFKCKTVLASLENLLIVSSTPYCECCKDETEIVFSGFGKICRFCGSDKILRKTPRGQITDMENLLMILLSYDCPVQRFKDSISFDEQSEMLKDGCLLKLFGILYSTDELYDWLRTTTGTFNQYPYSKVG